MATVLRCVFFFIHLKHFLISVLRHQCVNLSKSLFPDGTKARKSRSKRTHRTNWKWFRFTHKPLKDKYFKQFARHQKGNVSVNWRWFKCQKKCSIVKKKSRILSANSQSVQSFMRRRRNADRSGKGLRHFSMKVCKKVEEKGTTTYNEVADELVEEVRLYEVKRKIAEILTQMHSNDF